MRRCIKSRTSHSKKKRAGFKPPLFHLSKNEYVSIHTPKVTGVVLHELVTLSKNNINLFVDKCFSILFCTAYEKNSPRYECNHLRITLAVG